MKLRLKFDVKMKRPLRAANFAKVRRTQNETTLYPIVGIMEHFSEIKTSPLKARQ